MMGRGGDNEVWAVSVPRGCDEADFSEPPQ